jgi:hypothetical protein
MFSNPFTPVFGNEPPIIGGRDKYINDVLRGLDNAPGDPNRVTIFTGPRGSGKTVLLGKIASEAESRGWISVHVPATDGMLTELIQQLERKAAEHLPVKARSHITGLQVSGTGFSRSVEPEQLSTWRTQMDRYLDILAEKQIGLLVTVDEVRVGVPELVSLVSTFQVFVMEKRDVALLLAGLPGNVIQMLSNDSISFLRRAFRRELGPVGMPDVRSVLRKTIALAGRSIETKALEYAAEQTDGLPFLIQLIGYHVFNQSSAKTIDMADVTAGVKDAQEDAENMVLDATLADLTPTELRFLRSMLPDKGPSRIADITKRMGTSPSQASHYKRRLLKQGVISEAGRGQVEFAMPMLKNLLIQTA